MRSAGNKSVTSPPPECSRHGAAWLAVFAVLLQAILFGWHHHPLPLGAKQATPLLAVGAPDPAQAPAVGDQDCQICIGLHHFGAAPGEFVALAPPPPGEAAAAGETGILAGRFTPGFRARAPPSA